MYDVPESCVLLAHCCVGDVTIKCVLLTHGEDGGAEVLDVLGSLLHTLLLHVGAAIRQEDDDILYIIAVPLLEDGEYGPQCTDGVGYSSQVRHFPDAVCGVEKDIRNITATPHYILVVCTESLSLSLSVTLSESTDDGNVDYIKYLIHHTNYIISRGQPSIRVMQTFVHSISNIELFTYNLHTFYI